MLAFILATCLDISGYHAVLSDGYPDLTPRTAVIQRDRFNPLVYHVNWYMRDGTCEWSFTLRYVGGGTFIQSVGHGHEKIWRFPRRGPAVLAMQDHVWQMVITPRRR